MIDRSTALEVRRKNLTYLSLERLGGIYDCVDAVISQSVPGDFAEFGVALGGAGVCLAKALDGDRRYFGFDVFGMIPPPTAIDGSKVEERYKLIASGQSHGIGGDRYYGYVENLYDVVSRTFASFGCPPENGRVSLVRGLFEETLPKHEDLRIAVAHVDCDWYEPVACCLNFIWPRLSPGGFVIIDDYNDWEGCRKATDEFLAGRRDVAFVRRFPHAVLRKT